MKKFILSIFLSSIISCKEKIKKEIVAKTNNYTDTITIKEDIKPTKLVKPVYTFNNDFILGKFNFKKDTSFTKVKAEHSSKTLYLNKEVYVAFIKMHNAAKKEGVTLIVISGTRNFMQQKYIWERKWEKYKSIAPLDRAKKILEYSSMPSTSRHHWGTDMDINNLNNSYFLSGKGKKEYEWLVNNANDYGFYQVYTNKENGRTGYNLEKWHWSYLPLAKKYLSFYNENITYKDIKGFKGSELAKDIHIINEYVNGIASNAK